MQHHKAPGPTQTQLPQALTKSIKFLTNRSNCYFYIAVCIFTAIFADSTYTSFLFSLLLPVPAFILGNHILSALNHPPQHAKKTNRIFWSLNQMFDSFIFFSTLIVSISNLLRMIYF